MKRTLSWTIRRWALVISCLTLLHAQDAIHTVSIRDIATVEGVRENPIFGYGIVVGLKGTGDKQQTLFTTQSLANMLQEMGVTVNPTLILVKNTAAVMVTASLPPFAQSGMQIDA